MHFKAVEGQFRKETGAWQVSSAAKTQACLQQRCMRFMLHRHLHCSQSFLPFPSPNRPLLCLLTCSLRRCSSSMSHGWEGSLFLLTSMFLFPWKGQNMKSLVCWLHLIVYNKSKEKPSICTTGISKRPRTFFWISQRSDEYCSDRQAFPFCWVFSVDFSH